MKSTPSSNSWWGRHNVATGRTDLWQVGPLRLWIQNQGLQWRISWSRTQSWLEPHVRIAPGVQEELPPYDATTISCIFGQPTNSDVILSPALGDRPFVTRLPAPMRIMAGESVQLFIVTPLWIRLELAEPLKFLHELAVFRPSDTWFGPISSMNGELCYSGQTPAYLRLEDVPLRLHCAITSVTIRNLGNDALKLDRVNLPLPRLSLFFSPKTGFWTDRIFLERHEDSEMASFKVDHQPPPEASPAQFILGPRHPQGDSNSAVRAFSALFGER